MNAISIKPSGATSDVDMYGNLQLQGSFQYNFFPASLSTSQTLPSPPSQFYLLENTTAITITLPLVDGYAYNFNVNWGDGSGSTVTSSGDTNRIHTYETDGTYVVDIIGTCEGWSFGDIWSPSIVGDKLKITKVLDFGGSSFDGFKYLTNGFIDCDNLESIGTNPIKASGNGVTSFESIFHNCI
mgnify:CR=1 FL=1